MSFIKLRLKGINRSVKYRSELIVQKSTKVALLKKYIGGVLCLGGTLQLDSKADTLEKNQKW